MKYTLLLCFLLAFAISKLPTEYDNFLNEVSCQAESKDQCVAIKLESQDEQCCYINGVANNQTTQKCSSFPNPFPIIEFSNIMKTPQFKPLTKEVLGYLQYSSPLPIPITSFEGKGQLTCQEGTLDLDIGGDKYSDDDIKVLQSENYCLNYTVSTFMQEGRTADCKNAKLLQSSKDAGIECGDLAVNFKVGGSEVNMKTCILFSYEMFSKITLSDHYKELINEYIKENMGNTDKVSIELSDSKGRKFTFDSEKGIIIDDNNSRGDENNYNNSLNISKYFLLLILFLF